MAKAPALFLRNATGLVKGWSGIRRVRLLVHVGEPRHAWACSTAWRSSRYVPDGSAIASIVVTGDRHDVHVHRLRRPDRRHAPSRRRLRLADAHPRRHPRRRRRRRVRRHRHVTSSGTRSRSATRSPRTAAWRSASSSARSSGMKRGGIGFVLSATGWWFILALWAPIYGFILKIEFVQPLAALLGWQDGVDFFGHRRRDVRRLDRHDRHHLGARRAGHGRLRPDPALVPVHRPRSRSRSMFVLMLVSSAGRVQGGLRPRRRRACSASRTPTRRRSTSAVANDAFARTAARPLDFGLGARHACCWCPFMLFLLLYPNWGATLYGEVRGAGDFRKVLNGMLGGLWVTVDPRDRLRAPRREDVRLGRSSTPRTSTSSTTPTATRRPRRRSRSGATRRCWRRS